MAGSSETRPPTPRGFPGPGVGHSERTVGSIGRRHAAGAVVGLLIRHQPDGLPQSQPVTGRAVGATQELRSFVPSAALAARHERPASPIRAGRSPLKALFSPPSSGWNLAMRRACVFGSTSPSTARTIGAEKAMGRPFASQLISAFALSLTWALFVQVVIWRPFLLA